MSNQTDGAETITLKNLDSEPIIHAPTFAVAVSDDGGIDDILHAIYATEERQWHKNESRAHPEIGGQWITDDWLRYLTDRDRLWRFWYAEDHNPPILH